MPVVLFAGRSGELGQKVHASNRGGSGKLMSYLDKEEKRFFIDQNGNRLTALQAEVLIDGNAKRLRERDSKFHSTVDSFSKKELRGLTDSDLEKIAHARQAEYAKTFNRAGVERENLVYVFRIEHYRYFKKEDVENGVLVDEETNQRFVVKDKLKKGEGREQFTENGTKIYHVGDKKTGDQRHIHYVSSAQINLEKVQELKEKGVLGEKARTVQISPMIDSRDVEKGQGAAKGGFNRVAFQNAVERKFDQLANYDRPYSETFEYARIAAVGSLKEKVINEQLRREDDLKRQPPGSSDPGGTAQVVSFDPRPQIVTIPKQQQQAKIVLTKEQRERVQDIKDSISDSVKTSRQAPARPPGDIILDKAPAKPVDLDLNQFRLDKKDLTNDDKTSVGEILGKSDRDLIESRDKAKGKDKDLKPGEPGDSGATDQSQMGAQKQDQAQKQERDQKRDRKRGMGM